MIRCVLPCFYPASPCVLPVDRYSSICRAAVFTEHPIRILDYRNPTVRRMGFHICFSGVCLFKRRYDLVLCGYGTCLCDHAAFAYQSKRLKESAAAAALSLCLQSVIVFMQKTCDFLSSSHTVCYRKPMYFLQWTDSQRKIHCRIFLLPPNKALLQEYFLRLANNKSPLTPPVRTGPRQTYQKSRCKWYLEIDCCLPG